MDSEPNLSFRTSSNLVAIGPYPTLDILHNDRIIYHP